MFKAGRYEEALAILRSLAAARPGHLDTRFQVGMAAIGAAKKPDIAEAKREALLDEAIAAFRTMLIADPGLVRVRLELARAFFLKGEDTLATRHFEQVLAGKPPAPVVLNVNRFLSQMRARKRWSLRLGMALAPDSNISSRSDEGTIVLDTPIGRLPFTYQAEDEAESGIGISVWAGGEYQYPLEDQLAAARGRRHLAPGVPLGRVRPNDRFGLCGPALADRPRQRGEPAGERAPALALGRGGVSRPRDPRRGAAPAQPADDGEPQRFPARTPLRRNARILDGPLTDISAGVGWVATPTVRIDGAAGWGSQRTERERERHTRRWVRLGVTAHLPWGFTVGGAGTLRWTDYPADWSPFVLGGGPRRDLVRSFRLNAYNRGFTLSRVQPADLPGAGTTDLERTASRLQAPLRRAEIRAPVLTPWDSVSRSFGDHPGTWGRDKPPLPSWHGNAAMP